MANNNILGTDLGQEFIDTGFKQDRAKRGLITWIFGILASLLFVSVSLNIYQVKSNSEKQDAANKIIREQALEMGQLRARVDTIRR